MTIKKPSVFLRNDRKENLLPHVEIFLHIKAGDETIYS